MSKQINHICSQWYAKLFMENFKKGSGQTAENATGSIRDTQ